MLNSNRTHEAMDINIVVSIFFFFFKGSINVADENSFWPLFNYVTYIC